jgi:hypothetical protein
MCQMCGNLTTLLQLATASHMHILEIASQHLTRTCQASKYKGTNTTAQ